MARLSDLAIEGLDFGFNDTVDASQRGNSNDIITLHRGNDVGIGGAGNDIFHDSGTDSEGYPDTGFDRMFGDAGNDTFHVTDTNNFIDGGSGTDTVSFANYAHNGIVHPTDPNQGIIADLSRSEDFDSVENLIGSRFDDKLTGNAAHNEISGGRGDDELHGAGGNDTLNGGRGSDKLYGDTGRDTLNGGRGSDELYGGAGRDALNGGGGADTLVGGAGADALNGGQGADVYKYEGVADSRGSSADVITGFQAGVDKIDLSSIDANVLSLKNEAFQFIGGGEFGSTPGSANAGSVRSFFDAETNQTVIQANTDLDGAAEMEIRLDGNVQLTANDFVL